MDDDANSYYYYESEGTEDLAMYGGFSVIVSAYYCTGTKTG